jgi:putative restriction endonuclease
MPKYTWTREQTIVALNLYCKIPFNRVSSRHPDIIRIAKIIGRTPNSVKMKIGNFGSFDPELKKRGIVGLGNTSKLDEIIWKEFNNDWGNLAYESELLTSKFTNQP